MDKGYKYGLWLVPDDESDIGQFIISTFNILPHTRHITVICNCSLSDADKAFEILIKKYYSFKVSINSKLMKFNNDKSSYSTKDTLTADAAGWNVDVSNWDLLIYDLKNMNIKGDIPIKPHMTLIYRDYLNNCIVDYVRSKNDINMLDKSFNAILNLVDITAEEPWKWKILKSVILT
tara:strand:- start:160 stop:690 length:531 start_codon:yes stop_codon:yes gene_type:complete